MNEIYTRFQKIDINKIPSNFLFDKTDVIYKTEDNMYFCEESNKRLKPFYI